MGEGKWRLSAEPSAWSRATTACAMLCGACSLVLETDPSQCETRDDCNAFPGTICIDNACVIPAPGTPGECRYHRDCRVLRGEQWICRPDDDVCVPLLSEHCDSVAGDYQNENAIFVGSLLQTKGEYVSTGLPVEYAIRVALEDFELANNGLPPAPGHSARRPLVLVACNAGDDPLAAARHLAEVVQVPAIIGASFSGTTIQVATEVTIPNDVLLISPSATSAAITQLQDDNLVWRTSPSDVWQALALQQLVGFVEADVRTATGIEQGESIRLGIANKGDSYGRGLALAVEEGLVFNGKSAEQNGDDYDRFDYGDPANPGSVAYEKTVEGLLELEPHVLLVLGTTEAVSEIMAPLEEGWTNTVYRPFYVFADGGIVEELWAYVGTNDELRRRILGTVPGTQNALFSTFRRTYTSKYGESPSPDVFGAAGGYDAVYLIGYAIASIGSAEVTGPNLVPGLARLAAGGKRVQVGFDAINDAFKAIAEGGPLDFDGASGPLDFDITTGEALSDFQIWCLPKDENGAATTARLSGWYMDAQTKQLTDRPATLCE